MAKASKLNKKKSGSKAKAGVGWPRGMTGTHTSKSAKGRHMGTC